MIAVNLDRVSVTYIAEPVFADLSWEIHDDRVVGLVGPNGGGKSSLLRLIADELNSETGFITRRKGLTIGYLAQQPRLTPGATVLEEGMSALPEVAEIDRALTQLEGQLADPAVYGDEKALTRALARQERLLAKFTQLGGSGYEGQVRATLRSLGFSEADLALKVEALSGGQKKLVGLARLLIARPGLLLLDEPDNHLDLAGKAFLEGFIRSYPGGVVLVSHDRFLLDLVVDEIVEIEDGRLAQYPGNYSEYAFDKRSKLLRQQQLFQAQQKEITRLEQAAKRLLTWGKVYDNEKFSKRGMNMLKRLEKIERIDRPTLERKTMGLELAGWRGSNKVLEIEGLGKQFPANREGEAPATVLKNLDLLIWRDERVGMVGPNGAGKSLLLKMIQGLEPITSGQIQLGPSVTIGYYAQEHETLEPDRTLIDTVRQAAALSESAAVRFLGRFLFTYDQARGPVSNLSGGERSRLQLALLMLSGPNFLLLDEPTNNLDIPSAEVLEDALADFEGTVYVSSHDRYFLDRVVSRVVELEEGALTEYLGNYSDYQAAK
jgi:ATP-binding cassette subfamily F protein 3